MNTFRFQMPPNSQDVDLIQVQASDGRILASIDAHGATYRLDTIGSSGWTTAGLEKALARIKDLEEQVARMQKASEGQITMWPV